jgi:hypothetical protein
MTPATDFTGRTIESGHVVVYPVRRKSDLYLNKLNVTQVLDDSIVGYSPSGKRLTIRNLKNVVIVPGPETGIV